MKNYFNWFDTSLTSPLTPQVQTYQLRVPILALLQVSEPFFIYSTNQIYFSSNKELRILILLLTSLWWILYEWLIIKLIYLTHKNIKIYIYCRTWTPDLLPLILNPNHSALKVLATPNYLFKIYFKIYIKNFQLILFNYFF